VKATTQMLLVALMLVPGAVSAAEAGKPSAAPVQTSLDSAGTKSQAQPAAEKPGLDVSRMPFDPQSIREVVRFHMPEIQECYEKALADSGKRIEGRVMVGFTINLEGNVVDLKPLPKKSSVKDDRVVDCVLLSVRSWAFPKPSDNRLYPIEYPFDLWVTPDVKETKAIKDTK
jgi:outer membrane biosynthesis protein TonB